MELQHVCNYMEQDFHVTWCDEENPSHSIYPYGRLSTGHLQHVNSLGHCRALTRMHHCHPVVIDAALFQEHSCSEMATVKLLSPVHANSKVIAPEQNIIKIPTKLQASSLVLKRSGF